MEAKQTKKVVETTTITIELTQEEAKKLATGLMAIDWFQCDEMHKELLGGLYALFDRGECLRLNRHFKAFDAAQEAEDAD